MMQKFSIYKSFFTLATVVLILSNGCQKSEEEISASSEAINVTLGQVELREINRQFQAAATLEAKHQATLAFLQGGYVQSADYQMGDYAAKGDTLAALDTRALQADYIQAEAIWGKAEIDYRRAQELYKTSSIPLEKLDEAETRLAMTEAAMKAASFALEHGYITAPFNGVIVERYIEAGQIAAPGQPVYHLLQHDMLKMTVGIAERFISYISEGDVAEIRLIADSSEVAWGKVTALPPAAEAYKGVMPVRVECLNPGDWRPWMAVRVILHSSVPQRILTIPAEAVRVTSEDQAYCYRYRAQTEDVVKTILYLGAPVGGRLEVISGIDQGSMVVCGGIGKVRDGDSVVVIGEPGEN